MKLATREDIDAPIEAVFEQLSDFDGFERAVLRRGAEVQRIDTLVRPGPGMAWRTEFAYRGRRHEAQIDLADFAHPDRLRAAVRLTGVEMDLVIDLVAMSRNRTRMNLSVDARPKTIPARLMIQSLKLARANMLRRFRKRIALFAADIEARAQSRAG